MNKKTKRPGKKISGPEPQDQQRMFLCDLHEGDFASFDLYRRPVAQSEAHQPATVRVTPDLSKAISKIARAYASKTDTAKEKAARQHTRTLSAIMREFEAHAFNGSSDFPYRKSFKDNLREAILDLLAEPSARLHIHDGCVLLPTGYMLSGRTIGGFRRVAKPEQQVTRLLIEALVWKSRRTLGLLWTLAQQGEKHALLRLAQVIVPFVKAINEQATNAPQLFGNWPRSLPYWPVMKSPHHDLDSDHRKILRFLRIGEDFPLTVAEEARWTARDPIGKWAIHLCQEIEIMQEGHAVDEDSEPWEHKLEKLERFSGETWRDWWEVAHGLLRHDYIDVVEIPELNKMVRASADRKSRGRIRKRILQAMRDKFKSMAWQNKVK